MAFHFKLEQVLTYRRNLEEQAQLNLAKVKTILDNFKRQLVNLKTERLAFIDNLEERKKKSVPAPEFSFYMECIETKEAEIEEQNTVVEKQKSIIEKARFALFERVKERKVIEKLREKGLQEYTKESIRKEQNELDEKATFRFGRSVQLH